MKTSHYVLLAAAAGLAYLLFGGSVADAVAAELKGFMMSFGDSDSWTSWKSSPVAALSPDDQMSVVVKAGIGGRGFSLSEESIPGSPLVQYGLKKVTYTT